MSGRPFYHLLCDAEDCPAVLVCLTRESSKSTAEASGWYHSHRTHYCPAHTHLRRRFRGPDPLYCDQCGAGPLLPYQSNQHLPYRFLCRAGLCGSCYRKRQYRQRKAKQPPAPTVYRKAADVAEDWEYLREQFGYSEEAAASHLGMSLPAFRVALKRARKM